MVLGAKNVRGHAYGARNLAFFVFWGQRPATRQGGLDWPMGARAGTPTDTTALAA